MGFAYALLSLLSFIKAVGFFNAIATQFDAETQTAIYHCAGRLLAPGTFDAERDFISCLGRLYQVGATHIRFSIQDNQFYFTINGRADFRILNDRLLLPGTQKLMDCNTITTDGVSCLDVSAPSSPKGSSLSATASVFSPRLSNSRSSPEGSCLSATAPVFLPSSRSSPTATVTTTATTTPTESSPPTSPPATTVVYRSPRQKLLGQLMGLTFADFEEYRTDSDYYNHICSILYPGETPDTTTDNRPLFAKWQDELDIVPSPREKGDFNFGGSVAC